MNIGNRPPEWPGKLISKYAPWHLVDEIKGDLMETYSKDINAKGPQYAKHRYIRNALGFLFKTFFWKEHSIQQHSNPIIMISSYFRTAWRSLSFYKGNTIINVLGLVTGMTAVLIIVAMIHFEKSFDSFHSDTDRIYHLVRVTGTDLTITEKSECRSGISYPIPVAIKSEISSIEEITSMFYFRDLQINVPQKSGDDLKFRETAGGAMVEPSFFKIFDFKNTTFHWISGNPSTSLTEPYTIVLTRSLADKYFPGVDPIGRFLKIEKQFDVRVTGVVENLPSNTDFPFSMFVSYSTLSHLMSKKFLDWTSVDDTHMTFVKLRTGTLVDAAEKQIAVVHRNHTSKELSDSRHYLLQPFHEVHYDARFSNYSGRTISHETILSLSLIAVFLLVAVSINYINLATAQSTLRSKEIGLRKAMGGKQINLIIQFMTETFLVVLTSAAGALLIASILLPMMDSLLNIRPEGYLFTDPFMIVFLIIVIQLVSVFSGLYPALMISRFNPVTALKNSFATESIRGISLRKLLVVTQFTITQILVVGTFIVIRQMEFFQNRDLGFNKDAIVTFDIPERNREKLEILGNQLRSEGIATEISFSSSFPSGPNRDQSATDISKPGASSRNEYKVLELQSVDPNYLDLYKIKLVSGRALILADTGRSVVINQHLAKDLELGDPENVIGKQLNLNGDLLTVVGVMDNYYSQSLKEGIGNIGLIINPGRFRHAGVKLSLSGKNETFAEVIPKLEKIWSGLYPEYVFEYQFLDKEVEAFYEQEHKYATLFKIFSILFLLIGSLGLYGLITFVVNRKGKEVAIRKVLGAKLSDVLALFSREYVQLILVSFAIAVSIAWYSVREWLNNFSQRIEIKWWMFVLPGSLVLLIAVLVIISKSFRAAKANPVNALKYE